jgi:hypothetical protein
MKRYSNAAARVAGIVLSFFCHTVMADAVLGSLQFRLSRMESAARYFVPEIEMHRAPGSVLPAPVHNQIGGPDGATW